MTMTRRALAAMHGCTLITTEPVAEDELRLPSGARVLASVFELALKLQADGFNVVVTDDMVTVEPTVSINCLAALSMNAGEVVDILDLLATTHTQAVH
jgi:hypothetical protein